jgi:hypothetical protein
MTERGKSRIPLFPLCPDPPFTNSLLLISLQSRLFFILSIEAFQTEFCA